MMKYFLFSILFFIISCKSDYSGLRQSNIAAGCFDAHGRDEFNTSWYSTAIDVYGRHLSGLLFIKKMGDGSYRTVFTNEAGVTFFDFEFDPEGAFAVKRIIKQLDKKAVINTLRDDFSLLLGIPFRKGPVTGYVQNEEIFFAAKQKSEIAYFITDRDCASLRRLELASKRKKKVSIHIKGNRSEPETIEIRHHTFDMIISLKKIERE
jgi:hypothetical protein